MYNAVTLLVEEQMGAAVVWYLIIVVSNTLYWYSKEGDCGAVQREKECMHVSTSFFSCFTFALWI